MTLYGGIMQTALKIDQIKISEIYLRTAPRREKLNSHLTYFLEHGSFENNIVITQRGTLVDGYCNYIVAVACGLETVECEINARPLKGKAGKKRKVINPRRKRKILFEKQNGKCALCGKQLQINDHTRLDDYMTLDHIIPVSCGGGNGLVNLQGLCVDCNREKKDIYPA